MRTRQWTLMRIRQWTLNVSLIAGNEKLFSIRFLFQKGTYFLIISYYVTLNFFYYIEIHTSSSDFSTDIKLKFTITNHLV